MEVDDGGSSSVDDDDANEGEREMMEDAEEDV